MKNRRMGARMVGILMALLMLITSIPITEMDVLAKDTLPYTGISVSDNQISDNTTEQYDIDTEDVSVSELSENEEVEPQEEDAGAQRDTYNFNEEYLKTGDIMAFDWKNATDDEINHVMGVTDWYEIGMWLRSMSSEDLQSLLNRETCLVGETTVYPESSVDSSGKVEVGDGIDCLFYEYALEYFDEHKDSYGKTLFGGTSGYWYIKFCRDGSHSGTQRTLQVKVSGIEKDAWIGKSQSVTISHTWGGTAWLDVTCSTDSIWLYANSSSEKYVNASVNLQYTKPAGYVPSVEYSYIPDSGFYKLYWRATEYGKTFADVFDSSTKKFTSSSNRKTYPENNYGNKNDSSYSGVVKLISIVDVENAGVPLVDDASGDATLPNPDLIQYVILTPITYNVTYNDNGGTTGVLGTMEYIYGKTYTTAYVPIKEFTVTLNSNGGKIDGAQQLTSNYTFKGWGKNQGNTVNYAAGATCSNLTTTANDNITMYAVWQPKAVTLPTATRTGYKFGGWNINGTTYGAGSYTPSSNVSATAKWTANTYNITFDSNGGSSCDTIKASYDTSVTLPTPTRAGYTFNGWKCENETYVGSVKNLTSADGATVHMVAQWNVNTDTKYTVRYYKQIAEEVEEYALFNKNEGDLIPGENIFYGTTDTEVTITPPDVDGYYTPETQNVTILGDGSAVVSFYYKLIPKPKEVIYYVKHYIQETPGGKYVLDSTDEVLQFEQTVETPALSQTAIDKVNAVRGCHCVEPQLQEITVERDLVVEYYYKCEHNRVNYTVEHYVQETPNGEYQLDGRETFEENEFAIVTPSVSQNSIDKVNSVRGCHCVEPQPQEKEAEDGLVIKYYYECAHNRVDYTVEHYIQKEPDGKYYFDGRETFEENEFAIVTPSVSQNSIDKVNSVRGCHCVEPQPQEKEAEDGLVIKYYYECAHNRVEYTVEHYIQNKPDEDFKLFFAEKFTANEYEMVSPSLNADAISKINSLKGFYCRMPERQEIAAKEGLVIKYYYNCVSIEKLVLDMKDYLSSEEIAKILKDISEGKDISVSYKDTVYKFTPEKNGELSISDVSSTQPQIIIPEQIVIDGKEYPITIIKERAFENNTTVKEVVVGANVKEIKEGAFSGCTSLETVVLPEGVTNIDSRSFYNCTSLTEMKMPETLTNIGESAFENCTSLKKVTLGKELKKIGSKAFYNCKSLTSIKIPKEVTSIGSYAFGKCKKLKTVSFALGSKLSSIGNGVFSNCLVLSKIKLPSKIKKIPAKAFYNCKKIKQITLGKNIQSIGSAAFKNCKALRKISLPTKVKTIGNNAFENCIKITTVKIPKNVTKIGAKAFYGCKALKKVVIQGKKLKTVGKKSFKKCKKGIKFTYPRAKASDYKKKFKGKY